MLKLSCIKENSRYLCRELLKVGCQGKGPIRKVISLRYNPAAPFAHPTISQRLSKEGGIRFVPSRVWEGLVALLRAATRIPGPRQEESNNSRRVGLTFTLVAGGVFPLSEWLDKINADLSGRRRGIHTEKEKRIKPKRVNIALGADALSNKPKPQRRVYNLGYIN